MLTDIVITFFTLYGAGKFALGAFAFAEKCTEDTEQNSYIRVEKTQYSPEVEKIINKYTGNKVA